MSTYTGPTLMFQHCLDELKGWPDESALDFDAYLSTNVTVDPVYGGSCVHVNQSGQFELGVGAGPGDMGIFLLQGSHELDVANPGGNNWTPIAPAGPNGNPIGKMSGLVATGAYELETTEFDPTTTIFGGANVHPNIVPGQMLTAPTEAAITTGTDKSMAGKLFAFANWPGGAGDAVIAKNYPVCAVCSRVTHWNHHRVPVTSFWPVYLPKQS